MASCAGISSLRLGIAFACVIGAGLASVVGALAVLFVPIKSDLILPASLSFAAGVMVYISMVDIYAGKAVGHFEDAGNSPATAFTYASLCFLCGFPISWILDKIAERVVHQGHACAPSGGAAPELPPPDAAERDRSSGSGSESGSGSSRGSSPEPSSHVTVMMRGTGAVNETGAAAASVGAEAGAGHLAGPLGDSPSDTEKRGRRLVHMGLLAAMAMALHNMPEGLVTFVGYMDSIASGSTTAIAIAVHNIPEGMVVASAVYFGTGNRRKALLWASVSAIAEPLGGLIGLAVVCGGSLTDTVFGILFGLVAGIMVYISLKELLPSSRQFDPHDRVSTVCMMVGMALMACSLVAIGFSQAGPQDQEQAVREAAAAAVLAASAAGGTGAQGPGAP